MIFIWHSRKHLLRFLREPILLILLSPCCCLWSKIAFAQHIRKYAQIESKPKKKLTSLRETLGTGTVVVVISISPSISDMSSEKPFVPPPPLSLPPPLWLFCDEPFSIFNCRFWCINRPITNDKHSNTPIVTDINRYKKNFSWFSTQRTCDTI